MTAHQLTGTIRAYCLQNASEANVIRDFPAIFNFLESLMEDPEREFHQGMGWFLREAWKKDAHVTETFLLKWKNTAPRLIIHYATEKMTAEQKMKFKKEKNHAK